MTDHELLRAWARIKELLQCRAHLQLDAGHGHARGMPAAQDEHHECADQHESAEERADAHGGPHDLAKLSEHTRRGVELSVKDVEPLHKGDGDENHRQDERQLDPAEDVELKKVARIRERA